jgi:hypothetical protein
MSFTTLHCSQPLYPWDVNKDRSNEILFDSIAIVPQCTQGIEREVVDCYQTLHARFSIPWEAIEHHMIRYNPGWGSIAMK